VLDVFNRGYAFLPLSNPDLRESADGKFGFDVQDMNYSGSTCICRVPKAQLKENVIVECTHCGASLFLLSLHPT